MAEVPCDGLAPCLRCISASLSMTTKMDSTTLHDPEQDYAVVPVTEYGRIDKRNGHLWGHDVINQGLSFNPLLPEFIYNDIKIILIKYIIID